MSKTDFFYHTHDPRYGPKSAASSKNGKFFVTDFFLFHLLQNHSKMMKNVENRILLSHPWPEIWTKKMLPAVKMVHISGHGCDKRIRFSTFFIIFRWFYSKRKKKKIDDKKFPIFTAGSTFWSISRVMGVIKEIGFRHFSSFSDGFTAK